MTDEDGFRIEAAEQFGFTPTDPDAERYECTEAQLIAFAKACERKGLADTAARVRKRASDFGYLTTTYSDLILVARDIEARIAEIDAVNAPLLEAERARSGDNWSQCGDGPCPMGGKPHVSLQDALNVSLKSSRDWK